MPKQPVVDLDPQFDYAAVRADISLLKAGIVDLQDVIASLPIPKDGACREQPIGGEFISFASPNANQLPGTALCSCQSYKAWQNNDPAATKDRTVTVDPANPPNGFPKGSTVTVFVAAPGAAGGPPPAGAPGQTIGAQGGSAGFPVPAGQAIFVHYQATNRNPVGIRVKISQSA